MLYLFITISATVLGQIAVKIGANSFTPPPLTSIKNIFLFVWGMLTNFYLFSGLALAFIAAMSWIITLKKFDLSFAYPFMSLPIILVMLLSGILFKEQIGPYKIIATLLIVSGILVLSKAS